MDGSELSRVNIFKVAIKTLKTKQVKTVIQKIMKKLYFKKY